MMDTMNYNENDDKTYGLDKIISSSTLFLLRRQLSTFQLLTDRNLRGAMPPAKMQSLRIRDCRVICRGKVNDIRRSLTANHQPRHFIRTWGPGVSNYTNWKVRREKRYKYTTKNEFYRISYLRVQVDSIIQQCRVKEQSD